MRNSPHATIICRIVFLIGFLAVGNLQAFEKDEITVEVSVSDAPPRSLAIGTTKNRCLGHLLTQGNGSDWHRQRYTFQLALRAK